MKKVILAIIFLGLAENVNACQTPSPTPNIVIRNSSPIKPKAIYGTHKVRVSPPNTASKAQLVGGIAIQLTRNSTKSPSNRSYYLSMEQIIAIQNSSKSKTVICNKDTGICYCGEMYPCWTPTTGKKSPLIVEPIIEKLSMPIRRCGSAPQ